MDKSQLEAAKESVLGRIYSLEVQGCLPVHGGTLTGWTALFDGHSPDEAAAAVWALIDEGVLTHDEYTDNVDRNPNPPTDSDQVRSATRRRLKAWKERGGVL